MPFKLRLRKTRHYNVLSRNVLVLSVELIDKTTLECTLSADSTGLECLHNVCQRLALQQPEFFGLRYMSKRPYPKVRWVELDRPLKKQLDKYAQSPALSLAVQYYIHDVGLLQDDVTRSHYFLQVKQDVLEGKLRSNYEQAVLLASYSLQAEFGDHQPERHTPEYLKDFRLFPKQVVSEGEMASLLEAVVWQYSSLRGLAQALAETYYILEAQRLPGYGQETFIARDEKSSEVYLGASLLGIMVQPASGEMQTFYRWNDITNLINHKRNFGIECSRADETVQFTFEEPDAAKYVWKMCVKQHTFYKGNQDLLEGVGGVMETRSLAIPDLQSSVMASSGGKLPQHSTYDMSNETTTLGSTLDNSSVMNTPESYALMPQSLYSINTPRFSIKQGFQEAQLGQPQDTFPLFSSGRNSSSVRNSKRRALLPQYRLTPDYESALIQKYGPNIGSQVQTILYSSQPEIPHHITEHPMGDSSDRDGVGVGAHYNAYGDRSQQLDVNVQPFSNLHNTYSSPDLAKKKAGLAAEECHFIHGFKPPPPYPYQKLSSNSTPDLASTSKLKSEDRVVEPSWRKRSSLLTASLGCLGSPELSRTYENLSDLSDAIDSLRKELTKHDETSFLHSFAPNYSADGLDAIYHLRNGRVAVGQKLGVAAVPEDRQPVPSKVDKEPIYQNVESLLSDRRLTDGVTADHNEDDQGTSQGPPFTQSQGPPFTQREQIRISWADQNAPETPLTVHSQLNSPPSSSAAAQTPRPTNCVMPKPESQPSIAYPQIVVRGPQDPQVECTPTNAKQKSKKPDLLAETSQKPNRDPKMLELETRMNSLAIVQEYESVARIKPNAEFLSSRRPENVPRNRYKDILPYEENRVKLSPSKDNKAGYVNASHITASIGDMQRFYICAQGPIASTLGHFWQCVWETDVRLVVMLASVEGDTQASKCFPYWPQSDDTSVECDRFRIYRKHSTSSGHHVTSRLQLVHMDHRRSRSVWHLQFTDWADHGCPQDTQAFITFLEELASLRRVTYGEVEGVGSNRNTPVLVHCSAGVGRSGVTILCDLLLEAADHNLPVDPPKVLRHLRQQRMAIVQSFNQYKFVYKVILTYLQKARLI